METTYMLESTLLRLQAKYIRDCAAAKTAADNNQLLKVKVEFDEDPQNPREYENIGKIICSVKKYDLGDTHKYNFNDYANFEELKKAIEEEEGADLVILPVYMLDHGGVKLSTEAFRCGFDSGQIGFTYCKKAPNGEDLTLSNHDLEEVLKSELEAYSQFLKGEIYEAFIENAITGEIVERCCGFYSREEAENWAREELKGEHLIEPFL